MAAAVFANDGQPIGALTVTGIEPRFAADRREKIGTALLNEAIVSPQLFAGPSDKRRDAPLFGSSDQMATASSTETLRVPSEECDGLGDQRDATAARDH